MNRKEALQSKYPAGWSIIEGIYDVLQYMEEQGGPDEMEVYLDIMRTVRDEVIERIDNATDLAISYPPGDRPHD